MSGTRLRWIEFHHSDFPTSVLASRGALLPIRALEKAGTAVASGYSRALAAGTPLHASSSWVRFVMDPGCDGFAPSPLVADSSLGEGEVHTVPAPLEWLDQEPVARRRALLDLLHTSALTLAAARAWDPAPLEAAASQVLAVDLRFELTSRWKRSPDRRRAARLVVEIDDVGDAWLQAQVRGPGDWAPREVGRWLTGETVTTFNAVTRSLRWVDADILAIDTWPTFPPSPDWPSRQEVVLTP